MVGRQLLGSLMGEWCLLQQLQGLVGVFLLASPAMAEWADACFAAVEAAGVAKHGGKEPGCGSAAAAGGCGELLLGLEDVDVVQLELLLQVRAAARHCIWRLWLEAAHWAGLQRSASARCC